MIKATIPICFDIFLLVLLRVPISRMICLLVFQVVDNALDLIAIGIVFEDLCMSLSIL
jgi:hypothetical protein